MQVGFSKLIITPMRGVPLAGYFNPRPNVGALDDLHVRCMLFKQGRVVCGVVALDVCMINADFVEEVRTALKEVGFSHGHNLIFAATHTHTAPYMSTLFGTDPDALYMAMLKERVVASILTAAGNLAEAVVRIGRVNNNPVAFNRRYWMRDGGVTTNPGVKNPDIVGPEGSVDREIGVLSVEQEGRVVALLANIVNHTDTVGEALVSADWPGRMERAIQNTLGHDALVMTLIGCSGNVNQFDVNADTYQGYSYKRTIAIGACYAECILYALKRAKLMTVKRIKVVNSAFKVPYRTLTTTDRDVASATLKRIKASAGNKDLTSEGLASGDGEVARFFAQQLVEYYEKCSGQERIFRVVTIGLGSTLALTTLPGEPFTEIGMMIKRGSPFKRTWPVSLAMGACGYVPLPECFARGGYETLPIVGGAPREDTAPRMIAASLRNLRRVFTMEANS